MVPTEAICCLVEISMAESFISATTASTALSIPRRMAMGLAPAATLRRPSLTMTCASSVAVVVPSPTVSLVLVATSFTSWAPMFSMGSLSSISLATDTPSLVMVGAPIGALQGNVATLGAERGGDGVSEGVHTLGQLGAGVGAKNNVLSHVVLSLPENP